MKKSKKILSTAIAFSMVAVLFAPIGASKAKAAGFTAIAQYDFESGTGMTSSGMGTAPTVVNDSERGNVLQFADGTTSSVVTHDTDTSLEEHSWRIEQGSPSSLKFPNPFKNRSLSGATISFWVKLPNEKAAGVANGNISDGPGTSGGIVGFVDSEFRYLRHPDCTYGGHSDDMWGGRSFFGITAKPSAYFAQIHHNWIIADDTDASFAYNCGTWQYCAMSITNNTIKIYINGKEAESLEENKGKRFFGSDEYENPGNEGMPFLLDFLSNNMSYTFGGKAGTSVLIDKNSKKEVTYGKVESNVECYVGFTGFSPTYAGTCIDDLTFFTKAFSAGEMASLYEAAKTPSGITVDGGTTTTGGGSASSSGSGSGSALSAEVAAAVAASTRLVSAPEGVTIGSPVSILKNDPALADTFNTLKGALDNAVPSLVAANPDWNGLQMSNNIYMMDIPLTGRELVEGETATVEMNIPEGFNSSMLWVLRINDDGTVTKCDITAVADGKLQFVTDKLCKFAVVEMTFGKSLPKTGVVGNAYFLILGGALLAGGLVLLRKKKTA